MLSSTWSVERDVCRATGGLLLFQDAHACVFDNQCQITVNSRRACRFCRLKKCFAVGMQRELLRARHQCGGTRGQKPNKVRTTTVTATVAAAIQPLDLLRDDRSSLTMEQWSFVSNVINAYNTQAPIPQVRRVLEEQSSYPMKIRLKTASNQLMGILGLMYQSVLPLLETLPQFTSLSSHDRVTLMERNVQRAGNCCGILISRDVDLYNNSIFRVGFPLIYGSRIMDDAVRIHQSIDSDGTLLKLLLPVLIFSTVSDLVLPSEKNTRLFSDPKSIFDRQNFYVEILFKYMIFRYGYEQAASRFVGLIMSTITQFMCALRAREVHVHEQLVHGVIAATERSLMVDEEPVIEDG